MKYFQASIGRVFTSKSQEITDYDLKYEFDWVHVILGLDHVHENGLKSFFLLNWNFLLKFVCQDLGFVSEKAQEYAKKCSDMHKAWSIMESVSKGILEQFASKSNDFLESPEQSTVENFLEYLLEKLTSPNEKYSRDIALKQCAGLLMFKKGLRWESSDISEFSL